MVIMLALHPHSITLLGFACVLLAIFLFFAFVREGMRKWIELRQQPISKVPCELPLTGENLKKN